MKNYDSGDTQTEDAMLMHTYELGLVPTSAATVHQSTA